MTKEAWRGIPPNIAAEMQAEGILPAGHWQFWALKRIRNFPRGWWLKAKYRRPSHRVELSWNTLACRICGATAESLDNFNGFHPGFKCDATGDMRQLAAASCNQEIKPTS